MPWPRPLETFLPMRPSATLLLCSLSPSPPSSPPRADPIAAGDAAWARRAEGHQGGRALPGPIDEAIAAYERAVKEQPDRLEGAWKLLRALHFKGDFTTTLARRQAEGLRPRQGGRRGRPSTGWRSGRAGGRQKLDAMSPAQAAKALAGRARGQAPLPLGGGPLGALGGRLRPAGRGPPGGGRPRAALRGDPDRPRRAL